MPQTKSDNRIVDYLRSAITESKAGLNDVPALLKRVIEENAWEERYVSQSKEIVRFSTFDEFVSAAPPEGLGSSLKTLYKLCADFPEVLDLINQTQGNLKRGGDRRSETFKRNNVTFEKTERGNSAVYSLQRLRLRRPDLHRKVLTKELTINKAMILAGFRKKNVQIPLDVAKTSQVIKEHFTASQINQLIEMLKQNE